MDIYKITLCKSEKNEQTHMIWLKREQYLIGFFVTVKESEKTCLKTKHHEALDRFKITAEEQTTIYTYKTKLNYGSQLLADIEQRRLKTFAGCPVIMV